MPSSSPKIADLVTSITADVRSIVADEIALAKAEMRPTVKRIGIGTGMFAAAGYFIISATIIAWFTIAAGFAWLFAATTPLSGWACAFLGAACAMVALIIIAVIFALVGKKSFSHLSGPTKTPDTVAQAIAAIKTGVEDGKQRVEAATTRHHTANPN
ncbi:MAG: phage holin family protein [Propionibacteriaceae bacterium]|jgi:membrane protein implicated in regulation of membrane protease activity|nr:phage holin family protein [Propionibacteriaceae bacterium]